MTAPTRSVPDEVLDRVACELESARRERKACAPVRDRIGSTDLDAAYGVQRRLTRARLREGTRVVGRKIGLTSTGVQRQLGVDRPDFGVLFSDMEVEPSSWVSLSRLLQPKVEAEVAFVLEYDLAEGSLKMEQVREAVGSVRSAIEIVDSRITGWDISFGDTVADNASGGLYVLGRETRTLAEVEPVDVAMRLTRNGAEASSGNGAACLGDPLEALAWLARTLVSVGDPLRAGEIILSGALGPMVPVNAGDHFKAEFTGLGTVDVGFRASRRS